MSLRGQILTAAVLLAVVPLAVAIVTIRYGVADDVTELDKQRVESRLQLVLDDLDRQDRHLATLLDALAETVTGDNTFRLAATGGRDDLHDYLVDFAPRQLALMDLDMLLIQDPRGEVVSSGHFREAEGELDPDLPRRLERAPGGRALMAVRTAAGSFLALVRTRPFGLAGATWHLTGGVRLDEDSLAGLADDPDLTVVMAWPGGLPLGGGIVDTTLTSERAVLTREYRLRRAGHIVRAEHLPLVAADGLGDAWLLVSHNRVSLRRTLDGVNRRLLIIAVAAALAAVFLAVVLAGRISRPLRQLAARTRDLDLERLDVRFGSDRRDEVGQLARLLDELTDRLRGGVARLRVAENRATLGEVARQVNHDMRNGLTPLRNVLRHLGDVAETDPPALAAVFRERRATLEDGLAYLEELAGHYARLSPARQPRPCALDAVVADVVAGGAPAGVELTWTASPGLPPVQGDPVSLRRIVDNLVRNAVESLPVAGGRVTITLGPERDPDLDEDRVLLQVADTGCGIPAEDQQRIFDDFYTTKPGGTGLGLSSVRRLVGDCGGRLSVASRPGRGSVFTVSFPLPDPAGDRS